MKRKGFICKGCSSHFSIPDFYYEKHGLNTPPYERVSVCPKCKSTDFIEFDFLIEKAEIAERLLPVISNLNRFIYSVKDIFGGKIENEALYGSVAMLAQFLSEIFDFLPPDIDRKILTADTHKDCEHILMYIRGEI